MSVRNLDLPGGEEVDSRGSLSSSSSSSNSSDESSLGAPNNRGRGSRHHHPSRRRRRRESNAPVRFNPALESSSDEGDSESIGTGDSSSRSNEVRLMNDEEQKQAAERDRHLSSFHVVTLSVDSGIVFPGDFDEEILKEAYDEDADPLKHNASLGRVGNITKHYCYMCEAADIGGKNIHLNRINGLADTVTIRSTDHVVNLIYTYYCEHVGRSSRGRRMGKLMIYTHFLIHVPNSFWYAKQDLVRLTEMSNIVLKSISHRDTDGSNHRLVMENFKSYLKLVVMGKAAQDRYFKLAVSHSSGRKH